MPANIDWQGVALGMYLFAFLLTVAGSQLTVHSDKKIDRVIFGLGTNLLQFAGLMLFGWLLMIHTGAFKP